MNSFHSPKNKYHVEVSYKKAIKGIGSVQSFTIDDIEGIDAFIRNSHSLMCGQEEVYVKILENRKTFPEFDWQIAKKYFLKK